MTIRRRGILRAGVEKIITEPYGPVTFLNGVADVPDEFARWLIENGVAVVLV